MRHDRRRRRPDDRGAAAVEMAIVTPLLLLLLFGTIQYGMLFHAMQAASATAHNAARNAAVGLQDCALFSTRLTADAQGNGVPAPWQASLIYPPAGGQVKVELTFAPVKVVPFVPMPTDLTQRAIANLEDPGAARPTCPPVTSP